MGRPPGGTPWNKLPPGESARRNAARCLAYYRKNKKAQREKQREYSAKNKEKLAALAREYYRANKVSHRNRCREYEKNNREKINAKKAAWALNKKNSDPSFQLIKNMRERIRAGLRQINAVKHKRTLELLGCGIQFLRGYLEAKFETGMTWENYGEWHVDHIIPCCGFDLSLEAAQKECFHYSNLQPLWAVDNLAKHDLMPNGKRVRHIMKERSQSH